MRIRICFDKHGKVRFTSHRDVARIWERALRRSSLPVAYSEGFSPRPKLSFGLALSTGHESDAEYLDVDLDPARIAESGADLASLPALLSKNLPAGMDVSAVIEIDRRTTSLQQAVTSCTWRIDVSDVSVETAAGAVARVMAAESLVVTRERKGKQVTDDLRPLVLSLDVEGPIETEDLHKDGVRLIAELGTQPRAVRVSELLAALEPPLSERRVKRLHQWITNDDEPQRSDPLSAVGPSVPIGAT